MVFFWVICRFSQIIENKVNSEKIINFLNVVNSQNYDLEESKKKKEKEYIL